MELWYRLGIKNELNITFDIFKEIRNDIVYGASTDSGLLGYEWKG